MSGALLDLVDRLSAEQLQELRNYILERERLLTRYQGHDIEGLLEALRADLTEDESRAIIQAMNADDPNVLVQGS